MDLSRLRVLLGALLAGMVLGHAEAASPVLGTSEGQVNFFKHTTGDDDAYLGKSWETLTVSTAQFMNAHFTRTMTFSTFFDVKLPQYGNAWVYFDSYAIYNNGSTSTQQILQNHPDWVLRDAQGNMLYINYACGNGTCTQYAANLSDPNGFRAWWINYAQSFFRLNPPYKGLWIDDVNLDLSRISDGNGNPVVPMDPNTRQPMTNAAWRQYFAGFMEQVRAAFPAIEIVHNSLWTVDSADPFVQREIKAADIINCERGVNDAGLTGGSAAQPYSLNSFLNFIDLVHSFGKGVALDGEAPTSDSDAARDYSTAAYLLISTGKDMVGDSSQGTSHWWTGYETNLGAAQNTRYVWNALWRRDFAGGMALLNLPGASPVTVTLPGLYKRVDGSIVTQVTLGAAQGAVLTAVSPACNSLHFIGGSVSPATVPVGGTYTFQCDYGATVQGIGVAPASGGCVWTGFNGTSATYTCTAGAAPGTFANLCEIAAGTPDNLCARTDAIAALTVTAPTSACDVNDDGTTNVIDVQLMVNQAMGLARCTTDLNHDGLCNVLDVQRIINSANGASCVAS